MALGPIGLDLDRLLGIFEGFLIFVLGGVDSGTVGVEDVVFGFNGKGLGEFLTAVFISFCFDGITMLKGGVARTQQWNSP